MRNAGISFRIWRVAPPTRAGAGRLGVKFNDVAGKVTDLTEPRRRTYRSGQGTLAFAAASRRSHVHTPAVLAGTLLRGEGRGGVYSRGYQYAVILIVMFARWLLTLCAGVPHPAGSPAAQALTVIEITTALLSTHTSIPGALKGRLFLTASVGFRAAGHGVRRAFVAVRSR